MKSEQFGSDEFDSAGETLITLGLGTGQGSTIMADAIRYTVSLAQHTFVMWGDQIFVVPLGAVPMSLEVIRLDRQTARELSEVVPALEFNQLIAVESGVEGFIKAVDHRPVENQGFAGLEKYFRTKGRSEVPSQRKGSFAGLVYDVDGASYLVAYNLRYDLFELRGCLRRNDTFNPNWRPDLADELASKTGWERVEACLNISDPDRRDLYPTELELLRTLNHSLSESDYWVRLTEVKEDEVEERKVALRRKMQATADRFLEALRFEVEARKMIPQRSKPDPFVPGPPSAPAPGPGAADATPEPDPFAPSTPAAGSKPAPGPGSDTDPDPFAQ